MTLKYSSVGIFCKPNAKIPDASRTLRLILSIISKIKNQCRVFIEKETAELLLPSNELEGNIATIGTLSDIKNSIDLAIVIGGDGTLLGIAREFAILDTHIVGINQGRLGFTTDLDDSDLGNQLSKILNSGGLLEERDMLDVKVVRSLKNAKEEIFFSGFALNDAVVNRGAISNMVELDVWVEGSFLHSIRGDGLIVCTPTGSTAYALSANGPIIHPQLSCMALVPIASQALSSRPITIPANMEIVITVKNGAGTVLHCDMQTVAELNDRDRIVIKQSCYKAKLVHPETYDYFSILRKKLKWNINPTF